MSTNYIKANFDGKPETQAAEAVKAGCDYNCGTFYSSHLQDALDKGAVKKDDIDKSAARLLKKGFQLGLFDPVEDVPYSGYGREQLDSAASRQLALEGATQSIVLLKNEPVPTTPSVAANAVATAKAQATAGPNGVQAVAAATPLLPLAAGTKVALIGPHFNASDDLLSQYKGSNNVVYRHTPLLSISKRGNVVASAKGCGLWNADQSGFPAAAAAARQAEVAVVFLGLHPQWFDGGHGDADEGEDNDRINITLADVQLKLLQAVSATGTPIVLVLINGGQVAIPWAKEHVPAIVEAFYPGQFGGDAVASILYGDTSPSGRLPYTMYDDDFASRRPSIGDMDLRANGGLTYMHYTGTPLWPFGWGLSYTTFELSWPAASVPVPVLRHDLQSYQDYAGHQQTEQSAYNVSVTNTGNVTSDVSVLAYATLEDGHSESEAVGGGGRKNSTRGSRGGGGGDSSGGSGRSNPAAKLSAPLRKLVAFCRLRAVAPTQTAYCEMAVAPRAIAPFGSKVEAANYTVVIELGDGSDTVAGRLCWRCCKNACNFGILFGSLICLFFLRV